MNDKLTATDEGRQEAVVCLVGSLFGRSGDHRHGYGERKKCEWA